MDRLIFVSSQGAYILNSVGKNRKASKYHISSKGKKAFAFPFLISIILTIIGCQSNEGLVENQRHEVIVPLALSYTGIDHKKDKKTLKPENELYFGKKKLGLLRDKDTRNSITRNRSNDSEPNTDEKSQLLGAKTLIPISDKKISEIGILLPLSGNVDQIGGALLDSIQLAFFELLDLNVELLIFDTRGTVEGAKQAAELAINAGVDLILGPLFGGSTEAIAPMTKEAGIILISFSNDHLVAQEGVYVFGFLPSQQITRIVNFAFERGYKNLAAFVPDNYFGKLAIETSRNAVLVQGKDLSRAEHYEANSENLTELVKSFADYQIRRDNLTTQRRQLLRQKDEIADSLLTKLQGMDTLGNPPFDSVLLPAGGSELKRIAPLFAFFDVDPSQVKLLGTTLWDETADLSLEPALVGAWYVAPAPKGVSEFTEKFKKHYGYKPPRLATLGYDAMLVAAALSQTAHSGEHPAFDIHDPRGFIGVDGIIRLLPNGTNERGYAVIEVGKSGPLVVDDAPLKFLY